MTTLFVNKYNDKAQRLFELETEPQPYLHIAVVHHTDNAKPQVELAVYNSKTREIEAQATIKDFNYVDLFPMSVTYKAKFGGKIPKAKDNFKQLQGKNSSTSTIKRINAEFNKITK